MDEDRDLRSAWGSGSPREAGAFRGSARSGFRDPRSGSGGSRSAGGGRPAEPLEQRLERWVSRGRDLVDGVSGARPGARGPSPEGRAGASARSSGGAGFNPARLGRWVEERLDWLLEDDGEEDWREPWQEPSARVARASRWDPDRVAPAPPPPLSAIPERPRSSAGPAPSEGPLSGRSQRSGALQADAAPSRTPPVLGSASGRRGLEAISRRSPLSGRPPAIPAAGFAPPPDLSSATQPPAAPASGPASAAGSSPQQTAPPVAATAASAVAADDDWPDEASFSLNRWQRPQPQRAPDPLQVAASAAARARPPAAGPSAAQSPAEEPPFGSTADGARRPLPRSSRRR